MTFRYNLHYQIYCAFVGCARIIGRYIFGILDDGAMNKEKCSRDAKRMPPQALVSQLLSDHSSKELDFAFRHSTQR